MSDILVIDNYDSFTYNLVHYIESIVDHQIDVVRIGQLDIEDIADYSTFVISPGPGLPKDYEVLERFINTYHKEKKILGVCLGMQAIGHFFGAELTNLKKVFHGVATEIQIINNNDPIFLGIPKQLEVGRYHSWVLSNNGFPETLEVTSVDNEGHVMSFSHKLYPVFGVQFHPESILSSYGKELLKNFLSL